MDKMVQFIRLYFPVFMPGAVFGKVIELSKVFTTWIPQVHGSSYSVELPGVAVAGAANLVKAWF
ncbi:hypothetical protein [Aquabacterium sp.]|uniref:hypothetical protein n=1 Tax=Aquabacterium sp. TaxID=1872578 RepID=UPI0024894455|nr:hypothetical protein [Aquabacterium sp.]MDI1260428.1 hypothetical protein [Aquabacterium sp.]